MSTPIYDAIKLREGFDPLEDCSVETIMVIGRAGPIREFVIFSDGLP